MSSRTSSTLTRSTRTTNNNSNWSTGTSRIEVPTRIHVAWNPTLKMWKRFPRMHAKARALWQKLELEALEFIEHDRLCHSKLRPGYVSDAFTRANFMLYFMDDNGIVAFLLADMDEHKHELHISSVCSHPMYAGHGLGKKLVDEAFRVATRMRSVPTWLNVPWKHASYHRARLEAVKNVVDYYKRLGFEINDENTRQRMKRARKIYLNKDLFGTDYGYSMQKRL